MKKWIMILCMLGVFVFFVGCSSEETAAQVDTDIQTTGVEPSETQDMSTDLEQSEGIDLTEVRDAIIARLEVQDPLMLEADVLFELYGITEDLIAQSACYVTMSGTFPDEIILIEAVDTASANLVAEALQKRMDEVLVQSKTYDAENYAAAQACRVWRNGLHVALILSPQHEAIAECYNDFIG